MSKDAASDYLWRPKPVAPSRQGAWNAVLSDSNPQQANIADEYKCKNDQY